MTSERIASQEGQMNKSVTIRGTCREARERNVWQMPGAVLLMLAMTACGGGTGDGSGGTPGTGTGSPGNPTGSIGNPTVSTGNLKVEVTDPIGMPAKFARVSLQSSFGGTLYNFTDANGTVEMRVPAGSWSIYASGPDYGGGASPVTIGDRQTLTVAIQTHPQVGWSAGAVANALVERVSSDGRVLELVLGFLPVNGNNGYDSFASGIGKARIEDCFPDAANDAPDLRADCIAGPAGFDAVYSGAVASSDPEPSLEWPSGTAGSFELLLLLDQSTDLAANDPNDRRLFAAKYLLSLTGRDAAGQKRVMLGAFAADDAAAGRFSALPQKPLALFPLENPQLTADGRSFFPIVDTLGALEGGAGALLQAVDRGLDFMGAKAWTGRRGIVVVSSGTDEGCGSAGNCARLRDTVIARSKALGVRIVTIGLSGSGSAAPHESMNLLAQSDWGGASLWLEDPSQFGAAMADAQSFLADTKPSARVSFRLESPTPGAFASGRTVLGKVRFEDCPWDCNDVTVPFAVKIP
jgi:hypothetical protein